MIISPAIYTVYRQTVPKQGRSMRARECTTVQEAKARRYHNELLLFAAQFAIEHEIMPRAITELRAAQDALRRESGAG